MVYGSKSINGRGEKGDLGEEMLWRERMRKRISRVDAGSYCLGFVWPPIAYERLQVWTRLRHASYSYKNYPQNQNYSTKHIESA